MPVMTEKLGEGIRDSIEGIIDKCKAPFFEQGTIIILQQKEGDSTLLYIQGPKLFKKAGSTTLTSILHRLPLYVEVKNDELDSALSKLIEGLRNAGYSSFRVAPYDGRQGLLVTEFS